MEGFAATAVCERGHGGRGEGGAGSEGSEGCGQSDRATPRLSDTRSSLTTILSWSETRPRRTRSERRDAGTCRPFVSASLDRRTPRRRTDAVERATAELRYMEAPAETQMA